MAGSQSPASAMEDVFLRSLSDAPKLRIGLVYLSGKLPHPSFDVIERLLACNFVEILAAVSLGPASKSSLVAEPALYRLYRSMDADANRQAAGLVQPRNCSELLNQLPAFVFGSDPAQTDALASCRLDVILKLGPVPNSAELAGIARFGMWGCRLGDPLLGDEESTVFWRTMEGTAPLNVRLEAQTTGNDVPVTLSYATLTLANRFSIVKNLIGPPDVAVGMIISKLWQLHNYGWDFVLSRHVDSANAPPTPDKLPTSWNFLLRMSKKSANQVQHRLRVRHTQEVWAVGIRSETQVEGLPVEYSKKPHSWIEAPTGHYYADPFLISRGTRTYLFVEDFVLAEHKGRLVCMDIDENGLPGPAQVVMTRPYHLSYPQVFALGDEIFMIPESGLNNTVELYRAIDFPLQWELVRVLYRGPAFDTTILQHDGRFWFYVTLLDDSSPQLSSLLMLFHSDDLLGDWSLHPASPLSRDLRFARGAGAPFLDQGVWVRPAQDCSIGYGGSVNFQRITTLNKLDYQEVHAGSMTAESFPAAIGVHTFNRNGRFEVIDVKHRVDQRHVGPKGTQRSSR